MVRTWVDECYCNLESCSICSGLCLDFDTKLVCARSWTRLKQPWLRLTGVRVLFLLPVLKTSSRGLASGASCTIRRWSYWRCCARSTPWCQTLFLFFAPPHPSPSFSPSLPHLESIKKLRGEEGKNPSTGNVFTMPGKARGTPFKVWNTPVKFSGPRFFVL